MADLGLRSSLIFDLFDFLKIFRPIRLLYQESRKCLPNLLDKLTSRFSNRTDGKDVIVIVIGTVNNAAIVTDIASVAADVRISRTKPPVVRFRLEIKPDSRFVCREDLPFHKIIISKI